jgi:hypothetical protein
MLFNRSPLMHSSVEAKEVSYASLNGFRPDVCPKNVKTQTPSQEKHNNTDDEDQCFEDTFDWSMELSFCEAVKIDANLQYEEEKTYKFSILNTCLEYPTCPRQALRRCCVPQRVGEGSGARLKPKSTT